MTTRHDGFRKRTRRKFKKELVNKGKISIRKYLQKIEIGDKVGLSVEPGYQKGMYRPKFIGQIGTVTGIKGRCYEVSINDMNKKKKFIVHPIHLIKV